MSVSTRRKKKNKESEYLLVTAHKTLIKMKKDTFFVAVFTSSTSRSMHMMTR